MFFKKKYNIMFRDYKYFGYITDNRNFGYKRSDDNRNDIGDKILSESGAVFLSVLDKRAKSLDEIAKEINEKYPDIDILSIKNDAKEFYHALEQDGFIVSGETSEKCDEKDIKFSYTKSLEPNLQKTSSPNTVHSEKTTQDFLGEYFNDKPQLTSLHVEITSKCNERCIHCYIPHENKVNDIDPDLFYSILKQCKDIKLLHLTLSGGEPMLHKNFCDFLEKCREDDFSINVLSNLTLLNEQIIEEMKANPLLGVQVSLYSMNPYIHDEITQIQGSFKKTKNAILKLIENDIPLKISCPILKQNKESYGDVIKWAKKHKIHVGNDYVILARYNHTTQNLNHRLSVHEVKDVINDIAKNDNEYMTQIEIEAEKKKNISENDYVCSVCHSSICITNNGNIHPCAGWQDYTVGNIKKTSLKEIWDNSEKVNYLRNLQKKDFPKCLNCSDKEFCTMCMVRNANEDPLGNPLSVNEFFCSIAKLNKNIIREWNKKKNQEIIS